MANYAICLILTFFIAGGSCNELSTTGCGTSKGCFSEPSSCKGSSDCKVLVSWKYDPSTKMVDFEVSGSGSAWVGIGLNSGRQMIGTKGELCYKKGSTSGIKGLDLTAKPPPLSDFTDAIPMGITQKSVLVVNNKVICKYAREANATATGNQRAIDGSWYLITAWGNEYNETGDSPAYHGLTNHKMSTVKINATSMSYPTYTIPSSSPYNYSSVGILVTTFFAVLIQMLM